MSRQLNLRDFERAVLNGMREELKDPRLIEAHARNCNGERQRLAASSTSTRAKLEAKRTPAPVASLNSFRYWILISYNERSRTAPVSHQKRPRQDATNPLDL